MDAQRRTIDVAGTVVSLLEWRPAAPRGPVVLLLHGGGADSASLSWSGIAPRLADDGWHVIAPDHPGFGRSPRASFAFTQDRLVAHVGRLVDELGLSDYVIGGLSLGGGLSIGHLLDRPDGARGALLLGTFGVMPRLFDGMRGAVGHFGTFLLLRSGLLGAMTRSYARSPAAMERGLRDIVRDPSSRTPELVRDVIAEASAGAGLQTFGEWQRDQVLWNRLRTDYRTRLGSLAVPTLIVHGERDDGVPLARAAAAADLLPASAFVAVPGAGHWVQRDRPDIVLPALLDHLRRLGDAATTDPE